MRNKWNKNASDHLSDSVWITITFSEGKTNMYSIVCFPLNKYRLRVNVNRLWNNTLECNDTLMRLWLLFHLHCIKDNWPLSSNYFLHSMKLMKHEKSIRQVLSLLTSTGKQFAVISLIHNNQMSQTLLWRAPGPSPLSVYFFSITYLPGLALIVVWTIPKASSQHAHYHKTIYPHSVGTGEGFSAFPQWGNSALTWSSNTNSERWDSLKKERWEELNTSYRQWLMRGMYPNPTRTDTDQPDWRHGDPVTVTFFSSIWSSELMNSGQFISGLNWNCLTNWVQSEWKEMGDHQDWCLVN